MTGVFIAEVIRATQGHRYGKEFRVLIELAEGRDNVTGYCPLSVDKLADRLQVDRWSIIRAVEKLEARITGVGIKVDRCNGRSNHYWVVFHDEPTSRETATGSVSTTSRETATGRPVSVVHNQSRKRAKPVAISRETSRDFATQSPTSPDIPSVTVPASLSGHPALAAQRARDSETMQRVETIAALYRNRKRA